MNERDMRIGDSSEREHQALDAALAITLSAPPVPPNFRSRLQASVRAAALADRSAARQALASEAQRKLTELRTEYVAVRRRTLAACLGVAFLAGGLVALALPWILQTFGSLGVYVVPTAAAAAGVAVGATWLRRAGLLG
jgi:hypothetical protein